MKVPGTWRTDWDQWEERFHSPEHYAAVEAAGVVGVLHVDAGVDFARVAVRGFHSRMRVGRIGQGACGKPRVAL